MDGFLAALAIFATPGGLTVIGMIAAAIIVLWDWRFALAGLFFIQVGVTAATVTLQRLPVDWATVTLGVSALACLMLTLSAQRIRYTGSLYQSGTWLQRALILALFWLLWRVAANNITLPEFTPALVQLFAWLVLCLLTILALSENPLFTAVGLLLWLTPVQAVAAVLVGIPVVVALVGLVQIMVALACSYLVLIEQIPAEAGAPVLTDITFPADVERTQPAAASPSFGDRLGEWAGHALAALWSKARRRLRGSLPFAPPRKQP